MTIDEFRRQIEAEGWAVLTSVVPMDFVKELRHALQVSYTICRRSQADAGIEKDMAGTVHHLPAICPIFIDFLDENPAQPYIEEFFEPSSKGKHILNSMGGNFNYPDGPNYASRVHRDVRSFWQDRIMLNTLVALDDTTNENGATWILPNSHRLQQKPADSEFNAQAIQVCAPAGSIIIWDSRLWHRAGENRSKCERRIITPIFTVPSFKQGYDYARAIGYQRQGLSDYQRQVLGYHSRVPANLGEWYRRPEDRLYLAGQG